MANPFNLLSALDAQDIGDIGNAAALDPSILEPPKQNWAGDLARSANDVTRFFGMLYGDNSAIQIAEQNDRQRAQDEATAVQNKLLPIIAAGRATRLEQARQDKLEQQAIVNEQRQQRIEDRERALTEHITQNYAIQNEDGTKRSLLPDEVAAYHAAAMDAFNDPVGALEKKHPFPPNLVPYGPSERQADKEAAATKMEDKRFKERLQLSEASANRVEDHRADVAARAAATAEAKAETKDFAAQEQDYRARKAKVVAPILNDKLTPESKRIASAAQATSELAMGEAPDLLRNPRQWMNIPYVESVYSDLPDPQKAPLIRSLAAGAVEKYGGEDNIPKSLATFIKDHLPKKR